MNDPVVEVVTAIKGHTFRGRTAGGEEVYESDETKRLYVAVAIDSEFGGVALAPYVPTYDHTNGLGRVKG